MRTFTPLTLPALLATGLAAGCSHAPIERSPAAEPVAGAAVLDPVGVYDLTMSSEIMVSEGTMEIRGRPGRYLGSISVGGVTGRILNVEAGEGHMSVHVEVDAGQLVLRLAGDRLSLSGNWVMGGASGERRGTAVATRRPEAQGPRAAP